MDGVTIAPSAEPTDAPTDIESHVNANTTAITMSGIASVTFQTSALAIYKSRALTAANVTTLYNKGVGSAHPGTGATPTASETGIVLAMPMDEGSGSPYDMTTNTNDGTLANVTWADGDGIPNDTDTLKRIGYIGCIGSTTQLNFTPALKIGDSKPLALLETDGSFTAIFHGYTDKA